MMSYPNFAPFQKIYEPNVHILAFLAEFVQTDFRVMVLLRNPIASIKSVWRRFGKQLNLNNVTPERFATQQDYLLRQLEALDRSFFSCVRYENVTVDTYAMEKEILSTTSTYSMGDVMKRIYRKPSASSKSHEVENPYTLKPSTITWLLETHNKLLRLCNFV